MPNPVQNVTTTVVHSLRNDRSMRIDTVLGNYYDEKFYNEIVDYYTKILFNTRKRRNEIDNLGNNTEYFPPNMYAVLDTIMKNLTNPLLSRQLAALQCLQQVTFNCLKSRAYHDR